MARKSKKRVSPAAVQDARSEYGKVKRAYHTAGKAAFGKPSNSTAKRDYHALKREYKKVGSRLGRLTGRKPR